MMLDFYRNLQLMPADRALQEAQLRLMGSERFAAAYYWAAFYLTGDWR
jgi:CHAT domain-containing protein